MPRLVPCDVAAHFPPLLPSCISRVSRRLQARGRELLNDLPELDIASLSLNDFAESLALDRLT
eukprot:11815024-Alexandrium_andersonii.AAC.1